MSDLSIILRNCYAERKLPTWSEIHDAADEIARLQEAKRRALYLADELAKEAVTLRATLLNIQALAEQGNPIDSAKLATRCRHALNQQTENR